VWRITDICPGSVTIGSLILYGINGLLNAGMTAYLHDGPGGVHLVNPLDGSTIRQNVPYPYTTTDAVSFDPVDPAIYYYTNGTQLRSYNINTAAIATVRTFSSTLRGLRQSADWIDRTGRYFLLNHGNQLRLWDKQPNVLYSGGMPVPTGSNGIPPGWAGLSPDGNYVIVRLSALCQSPKSRQLARFSQINLVRLSFTVPSPRSVKRGVGIAHPPGYPRRPRRQKMSSAPPVLRGPCWGRPVSPGC
jgi:hypothetical protein